MLIPFINKPGSSRDLIIFIISSTSYSKISQKYVITDAKIFFSIAASVAHAAAFNPNDIKKHSVDGLSTFFIKGKLVFGNGPKSLPKKSPDCPILWNFVFDNFVLPEEPFAEVLRSLRTCELFNINS